jgi:hypothetical protein
MCLNFNFPIYVFGFVVNVNIMLNYSSCFDQFTAESELWASGEGRYFTMGPKYFQVREMEVFWVFH